MRDAALESARTPSPVALWLVCTLGITATAVLVGMHGPGLVLGSATAVVCGTILFLRPELATHAVLFLVYINAPAVVILHGVPKPLAGAMFLLLGIPLLHRMIVRRQALRADRTLALLAAFMCVLVLSSLGARDPGVAGAQILTFVTEGLLLYWLLVNVVTDRVVLRRATWSLLAAGTFLGSLSIYQAATRSYENQFAGFAERKLHLEYKRELDMAAGVAGDRLYRADRAEGPQIGNNRYGQVMLVLLPLALLRVRRAVRRRERVLALAAGAVILVGGVGLTYSRGTLLGVFAVAVAALAVHWLRPKQLLIAAVAALALAPIASPNVYSRITTLGQVTELSDPSTDGALRGRATEMLAALHAFADHPFIGVGAGQYAPFYSMTYQQLPGVKFRDIQSSRRAHSLYLEMAAETGIIGLAVFLAIPLLLLGALLREHRRLAAADPELADTAAALFLGLVGFLFTALFLSHAFERYYWLVIALGGATVHIARRTSARC